MAELIQCDNCGAVLLEEDLFCGECGAPRPTTTAAPGPPVPEPAPAAGSTAPEPSAPEPTQVPPSPRLGQPPEAPEKGWRVAFLVLLVLGVLACIAGLAGFLFMGLVGSETATAEENWLGGTLCCLLPLGGTGVILAIVDSAIWYTRLRK